MFCVHFSAASFTTGPDVATNADQLREFVKQAGGPTAVAKLLGVTRPYVSLLQAGQRLPSLRIAIAIERLTAPWEGGPIRTSLWLSPTASTTAAAAVAGSGGGPSSDLAADETKNEAA